MGVPTVQVKNPNSIFKNLFCQLVKYEPDKQLIHVLVLSRTGFFPVTFHDSEVRWFKL